MKEGRGLRYYGRKVGRKEAIRERRRDDEIGRKEGRRPLRNE